MRIIHVLLSFGNILLTSIQIKNVTQVIFCQRNREICCLHREKVYPDMTYGNMNYGKMEIESQLYKGR